MTLPAAFYDRPVLDVAQDLVGCVVEHEGCAGVIVETEAYHHSEPACHAYVGLTPRTSVLFGAPGRAYVYRSYGIHALLNAVCEGPDVGAAVLIRALEPLEGLDRMRERRGVRDDELCNGPGKLTQALGIDLELNATSLVEGPVLVHGREEARFAEPELVAGPRIGITRAADLPWRFCAAGSRAVSRPWPPRFRDTVSAVARGS
ncbi:MAG TPA: DNA-3-methyladenine glycosylase [Baekduia sp.]|nr:DNA-3-methyladenine glycosylase [Baekduia sp.]